MHLLLERPTAVPPDALFAWWTDLRDGPDDHAFLHRHGAPPAGLGRTVHRRADGTMRVEDRGRFLGLPLLEHYEVRPDAARREVRLEGGNNFSRFSATYRFETGRAVLEAHVAPLGGLAVLDVLLRPLVRRFLAADLEGHLADAARELAG